MLPILLHALPRNILDRSWRGGTSPIFKAAVHQTKAAMDRKALNATQLNEENKKNTIVKCVPLYCFCKSF